jgi:hypothetical protein
MELSEDSIRFMISIYNIEFAWILREEIVSLATKHCYGVKSIIRAKHNTLV